MPQLPPPGVHARVFFYFYCPWVAPACALACHRPLPTSLCERLLFARSAPERLGSVGSLREPTNLALHRIAQANIRFFAQALQNLGRHSKLFEEALQSSRQMEDASVVLVDVCLRRDRNLREFPVNMTNKNSKFRRYHFGYL